MQKSSVFRNFHSTNHDENNFKENLKARDEFNTLIDTSYFEGTWSKDKASKLNKELFSIADKKYSQLDFANYLENHQTKRPKIDASVLVKTTYEQFVNDNCIAYQETILDKNEITELFFKEF